MPAYKYAVCGWAGIAQRLEGLVNDRGPWSAASSVTSSMPA